MTTRYLVTGGAGFIGGHIVRTLLARGDAVRVFDNFATGSRGSLNDVLSRIELLEGDVRCLPDCRRAVAGAGYVIHQAALPSVPRSLEDPITSHEVNATGTLNLLCAAREAGVRRFLYASSSSVYGPEPKLPREESDRPHPISPYAVAKLAGEQYCRAFAACYGLETVALRYFNVFGPRQRWDSPYAAVLPRFISALRRGEPVTIFGDGQQGRDFTYVENVVRGNLLALQAPGVSGRVYNVAGGRTTTVNQLLALTAGVMGAEPRSVFQPPRAGDVRDSLADIRRARADLDYEPSVSLEEGLRHTITWALAQPE